MEKSSYWVPSVRTQVNKEHNPRDFREVKKIVESYTIVKPSSERICFLSNSNITMNIEKKKQQEIIMEK
jgi:hypothetical protein